MAEKTRTVKKSPASKAGSRPAAKQAPKKNVRTNPKQAAQAKRQQSSQIRAILLFAAAIFLGCLTLIEGDNLWKWGHELMLGLFGGWVLLGSVLMIYIAIVTSMEKKGSPITSKIWLNVGIIVLCCTAGFLFGTPSATKQQAFGEMVAGFYQNHTGVQGGAVGGIIGTGFRMALGDTGSKILVILILFVCVMVLTGTTLIQLIRTIRKPVDVVSDGIQNAKQKREESSSVNIDIPLEEALPGQQKAKDMTEILVPPQKKPKERNTDKLDRLKAAFGIEDQSEASKEVSEKISGEILEQAAPDAADTVIQSVHNMFDEDRTSAPSISFKTPTVHIPKPSAAEETSRSLQKQLEDSEDEEIQLAKDAEKAAADFIKKHAENEKKELSDVSAGIYQADSTKPSSYIRPPITMLEAGKRLNPAIEADELQTNGRILVETLKSFGVQTKILDICRGPTVTRYELQPAAGVKISKITNLSDDLAMNLAATGVRIEAPIPGKAAVGIEVPNKTKSIVRMRELIESNSFSAAKSKLAVALGRDIAGQVVVADLAKMPHILIAGTTGSGKSVCINSLIVSTLYKSNPDEVRFLMIDPKVVELGIYNGIPHLLVPVVTDPRKAAGALGWAVNEMLNRYKMFAANNVRDLEGYNSLAETMGFKDEDDQPMPKMPQIVIIIDELSDLMMAAPNEVEDAICRLAQMARAAGMHLVVATQRPSVDVVTGLIKANIPSRIAFAVSSAVDSRTVLDGGGAEKLLGQGDMLFAPVGASKPLRVQGCYVSDAEIESIVEFVKKSYTNEYDDSVIEEIERNAVLDNSKNAGGRDSEESTDPMMEDAIKCVIEAGQASTSLLQRRLRLGYARAGRLVDEMEQMGIVGPHEGSKPRQVLMTYAQWLERNMQKSDEE